MKKYKLCVFVPASHLEILKDAIFAAGGGKQGDYSRCCWQVAGQGQFYAEAGADPYIGEVGKETHVTEYRVEFLCDESLLKPMLKALYEAHPYEEPAFDVVELLDVGRDFSKV